MYQYSIAELETIYDNSNDDQKQWLLDNIGDWFEI